MRLLKIGNRSAVAILCLFVAVDASGAAEKSSANAVCDKAFAAFNSGRFEQCIPGLTQAFKHGPRRLEALECRAYALLKTGHFIKSVCDYSQLFCLQESHNRVAMQSQAWALCRMSKDKDALTEMDKLVQRNSTCSWAFAGRGVSLVGLKQYSMAATDFKKAIALAETANPHTPDSPASWKNDYLKALHGATGSSLERDLSFQEAADELSKLIEMDGQIAQAYLQRSRNYEVLGRHNLALKDEQTAKQIERRLGN